MGLFTTRHATITTPEQLLAERAAGRRSGGRLATPEESLGISAVWAAQRLRADLVSTMPVDAYRRVATDSGTVEVEVAAPPALRDPGGTGREPIGRMEWLYSSQFDLDRAGNAFGLITAFDGRGLPAVIELVPLQEVTVRGRWSTVTEYRIAGKVVEPRLVWHERQFTVSGSPLGLSVVAHAALVSGEYLSMQEFALDWFGSGAVPSGTLRNSHRTINPDQARTIKERYRATVSAGDVFVMGSDWEYSPIAAVTHQAEWLNAKNYSAVDIARFYGVPADLIDAAVSGQSVTYANVSQRNLQFMIHNLGPAIARREAALSGLLPRPQYVKLNAASLLRMDRESQIRVLGEQITTRQLAPSEARAIDNRAPFTPDQLAEFDRLFGSPRTNPTGATT